MSNLKQQLQDSIAQDDVVRLLEGMRLDAADLRDLASDPDHRRFVCENLGDVFALHADIKEIIRRASPFREASE
jgi:Fe2+ or Zn2+ uptake regulation protein